MRTLASETTAPLELLAYLNKHLEEIVHDYKSRNGNAWNDGEFELVQGVVRRSLLRAESAAIDAVHTTGDSELREALRDYFLLEGIERHAQGYIRFDQIARLGDADSATRVFEAARAMLPEYEEEFNPYAIYGLAQLATHQEVGGKAMEFLRGAFEATIEAGADDLVSDKTFIALAHTIGALGDASFGPVLYDALAFAASEERDFELNVAASVLALRLSVLDYQGPLDALEELCTYLCRAYAGERFTLEALYALWLLRDDNAAALAYLEAPENTRSLGLAATACADLDCKAALPALERRLGELTNASTKEAFTEAIQRLRQQTSPPAARSRMIWMHGLLSPEELLQGADAVNVFAVRASITTSAPLGRQLEFDDSAPMDC